MTSFTSYLLVILIVLIILLTITYTTDIISIPIEMPKFFDTSSDSLTSSSSNIEYEKIKKQQLKSTKPQTQSIKPQTQSIKPQTQSNDISNFLLDNNFDSDKFDKYIFNQTEEFQMTENASNAIANALANLA
jgi:hypothetical protein